MELNNILEKYNEAKTEKEKNEILSLFNKEQVEQLIVEYQKLENQNLLLFGRLNILENEIHKKTEHLLKLLNEPIE